MADVNITREFLNTIIDEVAFKLSADTGENISILGKSDERLKLFLEENGNGMTDYEKAKIYSQFLTETTTQATVQAIAVAGDAPFKTLEATARANEVATKMAETKAHIEKVIPSEVSLNEKKGELYTQQGLAEAERVELMKTQNQTELKRLDIMGQELLIKEKELLIRQAEIPLKEAQVEVEQKRVELMDKEIAYKDEEIALAKRDAELKLIQALQERERIKLLGAEIEYKREQMQAVKEANAINERIEDGKNRTQIEVATIYATGRA